MTSSAEVIEDGLNWTEYAVFGASLCLTLLIGVFYAVKDCVQKRRSMENYLLGNRDMNVFVVAASIFATFASSVGILGDPVEVYRFGAVYLWMGVGLVSACPVVAHLFARKYNQMTIVSVYQYLGMRFNKVTHVLVAIVALLVPLIFAGIMLYSTALTFTKVTGLDMRIIIGVIGGVCAIYTTLGGMKAVLWADTLQMLIMTGALATTVVFSVIRLGGPQIVWNTAQQHGVLNFIIPEPDPFRRATTWGNAIGGFVRAFCPLVAMQGIVQRYMCLPSPCKATVAVYLSMPIFGVFVVLNCLVGVMMYITYQGCDPLLMGRIQHRDEIVPLFVRDVLGDIPGLVGLFLAGVVSAMLSTMSSIQTGMAANLLKDILEPLHKLFCGSAFSDKQAALLSPVLAFISGVSAVGVGLGILCLDASIFAIATKTTGALGGPIGGIFVLGVLFPFVDGTSALLAYLVSSGVTVWIAVCSLFISDLSVAIKGELPVGLDQCTLNGSVYANYTLFEDDTLYVVEDTSYANLTFYAEDSYNNQTAWDLLFSVELHDLYRLSPILYGVIGLAVCVVTGVLLGCLQYIICCRWRTLEKINLDDDPISYPLLPNKEIPDVEILSYKQYQKNLKEKFNMEEKNAIPTSSDFQTVV